MFPFARAADKSAAVRQKLAALEGQIAQANTELDQIVLGAVLGDETGAADSAVARLDELHQRRDILRRALSAAKRGERDEQAAARQREVAARRRAASQHAARLEREAKAVSEIAADLLTHFDGMVDACSSLIANLPETMRSRAEPWHEMLSPDEMRQAVLIEGHRLERERRAILFGHQHGTIALEDRETGALPTLTDRIAKYTATIREHLNPAAQPAPHTPSPEPRPVSVPVSVGPSSPRIDAAPRTVEVIDLRGKDLGVAKPEKALEEVAE
jgi:hypothetical protein